ncbi:uncharacterized protein LOC111390131 [Olea europaea var. sylvestris]|uniref:uncharacterized protein LOC111390131 n=1 Tax=Olea europaea var. sylvestris TaxID=158386 RepID=UPI000C1CDE43|nr:uncharacterized protein LOC111390131 [Olea europaea var. sylvestris]
MIRTVKPYNTARTAEIMSRYRPIAPKPEAGQENSGLSENSGVPQSMRRSPYLRNVWNHLQARPTRTRKRGRSSFAPPAPAMKRARTCLQGLSPPYKVTNSPAKNLAILGFAHNPNGIAQIPLLPNLVSRKCGLDSIVTTPADSVALPVLRCTATQNPEGKKPEIDLNMAVEYSEELDFMPQSKPANPVVITPRAVRPIGSTISVKSISENPGQRATATGKQVLKNPAEVEEEVEFEAMPAVVSDSNNRVRLTNSAYKKMVGQPECCWLDFIPSYDGSGACKRISGEVVLRLEDSCFSLSLNGFNCWVKIEWASNGKSSSVTAFCEAMKLDCEAKDYQFLWRFHKSEASNSGSNI